MSFEPPSPQASSVLEWKALDRSMSSKRCRCASAVVKKKNLVIVGGNSGSTILRSVEMYNPDTNAWTSLPPMATKRDGCAVTVVGEDMLVVIGGYDGNSYLNSVECFSFATETWSFLPSMSKRRWGCAAVAVGNQVYVVGGNDGNSSSLSSGEVLNIDTGYWSPISSMSMKREGCALVAMNNQHIYAIGGYGNFYLNSCEVYNISSNTWTFCAPMGLSRSYCAAVALDDREILVMGGQHGRRGGGFSQCLSSTEKYSIETFRWTTTNTPSMLSKRRGCTAGLLPDKKTVVVVGGSNGADSLATAEQLTLEDRRIPTPPLLPPFPNSILGLPSSDNPTLSLRSLQRWIDQVSRMKENYKDLVASATKQYNRELNDQRASLEEAMRKVEREHNHKIETLDSTSRPWFSRVDSQLEEAQEQLLQKQMELEEEEQDLLTAVPPDYSRMILVHRPQEPPPELMCPITLELMKDPVVAADGHTYERFAIEKVFDQQLLQSRQQLRSPKTGQVLLARTVFPNVAIRSLCQEFQQASAQVAKMAAQSKNDADEAAAAATDNDEEGEERAATDISTSRRSKRRTFEVIPY